MCAASGGTDGKLSDGSYSKENRSFQDVAMTSHQLISKDIGSLIRKVRFCFSIEDKALGQIMVQYQETDWEFSEPCFFPRMVPVRILQAMNRGIYLRVGLMDTEEDADWDLLPYVLHRNAAPRETKKRD